MRAIDNSTSLQSAKAIIETLDFKCISRNDNGEFWEIFDSYLALESKIAEPSIVPKKFEFFGWYRFFNQKDVGPNTKFRSCFQQAVSSNDEAKMRLLEMAISNMLVEGLDDCSDSVDAIPHRLFIISSSPTLIDGILELLGRKLDRLSRFEPILKRNLQIMRSVDICLTNKEVLRAIYRLVET